MWRARREISRKTAARCRASYCLGTLLLDGEHPERAKGAPGMFGFGTPYNYEHFTRELLDPEQYAKQFDDAPAPGERAPDFQARTLRGDRVRLSDFRDEKNVGLGFGSATCPMTAGSIDGINELCEELRGEDIEFLFVYVREAHPGEKLPAHGSWEDKLAAAERLREEADIDIPMVLDDVRGSIHRKYSKLPNPAFLIDKSGRVAFRMMWAQPGPLAAAIDELLEVENERGVDHAIVAGGEDRSLPLAYAFFHSHRALERGGEQAIADFGEAMGIKGKIAVAASRVAEPLAENAGTIAFAAGLSAAVIAGGLIAGMQLRKRKMRGAQEPYRFPWPAGSEARSSRDDYEAVGI